jgi:hypothetical protein
MNIKNIFKKLTKVKIMIHSTKRFYAMIFAICCMSNIMQSNDMRDEHGRTEIMNYLIEQEKEITSKRSQLDKLCEKYFVKNQETKMLEKRVWATDEDVIQYRKFEDEYDRLIQETIENIKIMVCNGAGLQARDLKGNSITDYCKTNQIYYALRDLGAPISLSQQFWGIAVVAIVSVLVVDVCYRICFPQ